MLIVKPNLNQKEVTLSKVKVISYAYFYPSPHHQFNKYLLKSIKACCPTETMWDIYIYIWDVNIQAKYIISDLIRWYFEFRLHHDLSSYHTNTRFPFYGQGSQQGLITLFFLRSSTLTVPLQTFLSLFFSLSFLPPSLPSSLSCIHKLTLFSCRNDTEWNFINLQIELFLPPRKESHKGWKSHFWVYPRIPDFKNWDRPAYNLYLNSKVG